MSSNLENSSGGGENYQYDQSQYFASNEHNVYDPALMQHDYHNHSSNHLQPMGQGLAHDADPQLLQHRIPFPSHWPDNNAPEDDGAHVYNVNQFDDQFYTNESFPDFQAGEASANYFNQLQFQQSHLSPTPQYQHSAQQLAWQAFGTSSTPVEHQSTAPGDFQNNQSQLITDSSSGPGNAQQSSQQLGNERPSIPQSQHKAQGAAPDLPTHWPLPPGVTSGKFIITTVQDLEQTYNCEKLSNFVYVGKEPKETSITKLALPAYLRRKSRNEISELLAKDSNLKSKHNKKSRTPAPPLSKPSNSSKESRKAASAVPATQDASDDVDSDSSSSEDEQPPLPDVRPTNSVDAASYDTIKAIWLPPYKTASAQQIKKGLVAIWDVVSTIRRRWKLDAQAVETAEEKKDKDLPMLKERVTNQRQQFDAVMKAILKHGHRDVIEHFGRHVSLIGALIASLFDLAKEHEWSVESTKSILEVLSRFCTKIDGDVVQKTNLLKVVSRFSRRGDDAVKSFTKIIMDHATPALENYEKEQVEASKSAIAAASPPSGTKTKKSSAATGSPLAGSKRPREDDTSATKVSKKTAASAPAKSRNGAVATSSTGHANKTSSTSAPAKKANTKTENVFASLQPAYKKSMTANATTPLVTHPALAAPTSKKPLKSTAESTAPTSSFSFTSMMAQIAKPKEVEQPSNKKEDTPPETESEKARRLRKEKRRGLRVSFKPDNELVQIRVFEHHPDEEVTHNASEVKDLEREGKMFLMLQAKAKAKNQSDRMDIDDEDEDDEDSDGGNDNEYISPSQIDFSDIPEAAREGNYAPLGGGKLAVHSPETEQQINREADKLVVVYASSSDIPPSPKEAPFEEPVDQKPTPFGAPSGYVLSRLAPSTGTQQTTNTVNISSLLESLRYPQTFQPQQMPQQPSSSGSFNLDQILAHVSQRQEQSQQATHDIPGFDSSQPQQQWNPMASLQASSTPQAPAYQQHMLHAPANPQMPPTSLLSNEQEISAALASIPQGLRDLVQSQPSVMNAVPTPATQQQPQIYENEDRRRLREGAGPNKTNQQHQQSQPQQWQTKKHPRQYVLPCKYYPEGKCIKGAKCTYIHEKN